MNCYYHEERPATSTCQGCGKSLCSECASILNIPICTSCLAEHIKSERMSLIKTVLLSLAIGIACALFISDPRGLFFAWVPFGWIALNSITPKVFLFLPLVGWVVYFVIKFVLSFLIGWIALPIKIVQWCRIFKSAKNILG